MDRETFLAALREQYDYDGDGSLEDVQAFIANLGGEGLEFDGQPITDEMLAEILGEDDVEMEDDDKSAPKLQIKNADTTKQLARLTAEVTALRKAAGRQNLTGADRKAAGAMHRSGHAGSTKGSAHNPREFRIRAERKAYDRKAANGETVFSTAEFAEGFRAYIKCNVIGEIDSDSKSILNGLGIEAKAHTLTDAISAGNTVPDVFIPDVIRLLEEYGVARRVAKPITMNGGTIRVPRNFNELTVTRPGQNVAATEDDLEYNLVKLVADERIVKTTITNALLQDSALNLVDEFANEAFRAIAKSEDNSYFNGDGTATYLGDTGLAGAFANVHGATPASGGGGLILAPSGTDDDWDQFSNMDPFHKALGTVPQYAADSLSWVTSRQFFYQVMNRLKQESGGVTYAESSTARSESFLGFPVEFSQVMPTVADSTGGEIVCYFGNYSRGAKMGFREEVNLAVSEHAAFDNNAIRARIVSRDAINVHDIGSTTVAGPIVAIQTDA